MKTVGIKDLKNNLSAYLREVRSGARILVSDRNTVVAELHEPGGVYTTRSGDDVILSDWIGAGKLIVPKHEKQPLPESPLESEAGTWTRLLDADRGDMA